MYLYIYRCIYIYTHMRMCTYTHIKYTCKYKNIERERERARGMFSSKANLWLHGIPLYRPESCSNQNVLSAHMQTAILLYGTKAYRLHCASAGDAPQLEGMGKNTQEQKCTYVCPFQKPGIPLLWVPITRIGRFGVYCIEVPAPIEHEMLQ